MQGITSEKITTILSTLNIPNTPFKLKPHYLKTYTHKQLHIELAGFLGKHTESFVQHIQNTLQTQLKIPSIEIKITTKVQAHATQNPSVKNHPQVKNVIAVGSGKGGVGKSSVAVNLSLALSKLGANVGILDADIYGPSLPILLNHHQKPALADNQKITPIDAYNLQSNSIGYLIDQSQPAIWRGPMATQALKQLFFDTNWQNLDYLIIDMPPGTGDIHLTLAQSLPITGTITVYTPQKLAKADAKKSLQMLHKLNIKSLGLIENMSGYICNHCQSNTPIFTPDNQIDLGEKPLGHIPIDPLLAIESDEGTPTVYKREKSHTTHAFTNIAAHLSHLIGELPLDNSFGMPAIKINTATK